MKAFLDPHIFFKKFDSSTEFLSRNAVTVEKFSFTILIFIKKYFINHDHK